MKFPAKQSASTSRLQGSHKRRVRREFRRLLMESLETRSLLATVDIPFAQWETAEFVPAEGMIRFKDDTSASMMQGVLSAMGAVTKGSWENDHLRWVKFPNLTAPSTSGVNTGGPPGTQPTDPGRAQLITTLTSIANMSVVDYAEPNFIRHWASVPDDTRFGDQYGLDNTGQPAGTLLAGTADADVDAPEAWDSTTGSPNTVIAFLDSGVDFFHPDLAANIFRNPLETVDGIDNDGNGYIDDIRGWDFANLDSDATDTNGHGTLVTGVASAVGNNNTGIAGVSWGSKILPLKIGDAGPTSVAMNAALRYIARLKTVGGVNIVVSNNSYGAATAFSFTEYNAVKASVNAGIPFVAAAGNNSGNNDGVPFYPASYGALNSPYALPNMIVVTATDNNDRFVANANQGILSVNIAAPGQQILSTIPTTILPAGYAFVDGTSYSAPFVSGAVALLKSYDPTLSATDLKRLILQGADPLPSLDGRISSGARLNIANSLSLIPGNEIRGTVFLDVNGSRAQDSTEPGLAGFTVFIDLNNNGAVDTGEPRTVSGASGDYLIRSVLQPGSYKIKQFLQSSFQQTTPTGSGSFTIQVNARTDAFSALNFGNQEIPGRISGRKWNDINGDGIMDANEPGIQGIVIYADVNNDCKIAVGEPAILTDGKGYYTIPNVPPGTYTIREVYQPGMVQTFPDPTDLVNKGGVPNVVVTRGQITSGINFGNTAAFDFGDAPDSFGTLKIHNGPVHGILQGFGLGTKVDAESDGKPGQPTGGKIGEGDDKAGVDDEDGVTFSAIIPGGGLDPGIPIAHAFVTVSTGGFSAGYLQGWIDFDGDGTFDSNEQIIKDVRLEGRASAYDLPFTVPFSATLGGSYARFRYGYERGIGPTGPAIAGEVEDYFTSVLQTNPIANPDPGPGGFFQVVQDSTFTQNRFNVLANDTPSASQPLGTLPNLDPVLIQPTRGGTVRVFTNGTLTTADDQIEFQPTPGFASLSSTDFVTYSYRVNDGNGHNSEYVTNNILVVFKPTPKDDVFYVRYNVNNTTPIDLDVLKNDNRGINPPAFPTGQLHLLSAGAQTNPTPPSPAVTNGPLQGTLSIVNVGNDSDTTNDIVRYTPPAGGLKKIDFFEYVVDDNDASTAPQIAHVTVVPADGTVAADGTILNPTPNAGSGFLVQFAMNARKANTDGTFTDIFDASGTQITPIEVDDTIEVTMEATDLRNPEAPFPGVQAAWADMLYDQERISLGRDPNLAVPAVDTLDLDNDLDTTEVVFGDIRIINPPYNQSRSAFWDKPGIVSEAGGFQGSPSVANPIEVYKVFFKATATGIVQFFADPADVTTARDTQIRDAVTGLSIPVADRDVFLLPSLPITVIGNGEGEFTNWANRLDVNADGEISPIDALIVINKLNTGGFESLNAADLAALGQLIRYYFDVNLDGQITAADALKVINWLNDHPLGNAEGETEGEGEAPVALVASSTSVAQPAAYAVPDAVAVSASSSDSSAASAQAYASGVDKLLETSDWSAPAASTNSSSSSSKATSGYDSFFSALGSEFETVKKAKKK